MKEYITWHQITQAVDDICNQVATLSPELRPDVVVGLTRGGLIPAVMLSHRLGIPCIPVSYSSKVGRGEYKQYDTELPKLHEGDSYPNLLIVDDICDSGNTMREVSYHYVINQHHRVTTTAIFYKITACCEPSFYWQELEEDAPWIVFPWEYDHLIPENVDPSN